MKLTELLHPWLKHAITDCDIVGLHNDSRKVKPGYLFIAYPGAATDGRLFVNQAISAGAAAIVYEPENWPVGVLLPTTVTMVPVPNLANLLALIASRFYQEPSRALTVTGVTGTNGKTTIAYQLAQAHELLGHDSAYIGTLGQGQVSAIQPLNNTTPDALCLQGLFHDYLKSGIEQACMEVSSHALALHRVDEIAFRQAIFTNLTHDHLDFHQTMEAYAAAKAKLFAVGSLQQAIINNDDAYAGLMKAAAHKNCEVVTYGIKNPADVRAVSWDINLAGTRIEVESPWGRHEMVIQALGFFNIYNALAIFTSLMLNGYSAEHVLAVMQKLKPAPGRMEVVSQKPYAIVDYAHTPDALENVLATLAKVKKDKIIVVFGCGGDRDKTKRPLMGKIACDYADIAIITSDNPRTEDPEQILHDIEQGIQAKKTGIYKIIDRRQAIEKAINLATADDIILVAGKGHESYQQIGQTRFDFSDQQEIKKLKA
ncbi:UDP-N-acetylmuramoyl-L-alanyl-D-glutamate--2,6-diaminopimelate ligase [Legionella dresdenensis]|uniref:UDP-N-acetylmuramoyl-L-alanyl-D-glutamate--2,6-diaminopimelate ligase n=1 Tax=Legionella dresdenensis TaxID=450200 RepID=A0ABV8CC42_9GAMM